MWPSSSLSRSLWAGGGTDEVLWELVAAAMKPDYDGYAELIGRGNA
jgi:acyl-ACP dehydrogenase